MERTAAVVTVSDKCAQGLREDLSAPIIEMILTENGFIVTEKVVVPDERDAICDILIRLCEQKVDLVVTTGGTGFSKRDVTPEGTLDIIERQVPGIAEAMRSNAAQFTDRAMLSRGICGIRDNTVIVNLPGAPKACAENLTHVIRPLIHGIEILAGDARECGRC